MPKSSFVDFKAIKSAITMEQVLSHYGLLDRFKKKGDSLSGPCPIHKGENPTQFRVSVSKNIWNCFSECKHGGNVLDFIARMENVSIHAAALKAIEWFHLDPETMQSSSGENEDQPTEAPPRAERAPAPKTTTTKPQPDDNTPNVPLKFNLNSKLQREHPYLTKERGLILETIIDFGLGYFTGEKGLMVGRIVIPILNVKNELVAYAGRWPGEPPDEETKKYKLPPNFKKVLEVFNLHRAVREPAEEPLIIVEGFFDAIKLHQNGYRKVVALMGWFMSPMQEELIRQHTNPHSQVIVMLDEDEAGQEARQEIAGRLAKFCFVKTIQFEKPGTQPEDLSADELQSLLHQ
jgi:DNA primase